MLELFRFTPALHLRIFSTNPRVHPWGGELEEGRLPAAPRQHPGAPPLLGTPPLRELAENPPSFLKRNSSPLAVIRGQPGLKELLLSTVIAAKKLPHLLEMKTKQNKTITSPASIQSKDTRQQFKHSPRVQTNKDACQGLRGKKMAQL